MFICDNKAHRRVMKPPIESFAKLPLYVQSPICMRALLGCFAKAPLHRCFDLVLCKAPRCFTKPLCIGVLQSPSVQGSTWVLHEALGALQSPIHIGALLGSFAKPQGFYKVPSFGALQSSLPRCFTKPMGLHKVPF